MGHVDGHKAAVTNSKPNNNTDEIGKETLGRIFVADKDSILSSTVEEGGVEDSSKQQHQIVGRDKVAKSEEQGLATKQKNQEKKVCDNCT